MSHRTEAQKDAIRRFEQDYFPTLEKGIVSKDITIGMRDAWAILMADAEADEVGLAVAKTEPADNTPDVPITSEDVMDKLARDFSEPTAHGIDAPVHIPPKKGKLRV